MSVKEISFSVKKVLAGLRMAGIGVSADDYSDLAATIEILETGEYIITRAAKAEYVKIVFPPDQSEDLEQLDLIGVSYDIVKPPLPDNTSEVLWEQGGLFDSTNETSALIDAPLFCRILGKSSSQSAVLRSDNPGVYTLQTEEAIYSLLAPPGYGLQNIPSISAIQFEEQISGSKLCCDVVLSVQGNKKTGGDRVLLQRSMGGKSYIATFDGDNVAVAEFYGNLPFISGRRAFFKPELAKILALGDETSVWKMRWDDDQGLLVGASTTENGLIIQFQFEEQPAPDDGFPTLPHSLDSNYWEYSVTFDGDYLTGLAGELLSLADYTPAVSDNDKPALHAVDLSVKEEDSYALLRVSGWLYDRGAAQIPVGTLDWDSLSVVDTEGEARWVVPSKIFGTAVRFIDDDGEFLVVGEEGSDRIGFCPNSRSVFLVHPLD